MSFFLDCEFFKRRDVVQLIISYSLTSICWVNKSAYTGSIQWSKVSFFFQRLGEGAEWEGS